MEIDLIIRNSK